MTEKKTEKAQTHIRIHNSTGFVMALDIDVPYTNIINLLTNYMAEQDYISEEESLDLGDSDEY